MYIDGRHENEAALNLSRVEFADEFADRYRTLILIAMIAALDEDGRAFAVADDRDRHTCDAPCIIMRRVRNHDEPSLLARFLEIDGRKCRSPFGRRWIHVPLPEFYRYRRFGYGHAPE